MLVIDGNADESAVQRHGRVCLLLGKVFTFKGELHLNSGEIYVGNWQNDEVT